MSVTGKGVKSIKKQEVKESRIPAIGFNKIRFLHKMTANGTSISLTSLNAPSVLEAPQYSAPNVSQLTAVNLAQFPDNLKLTSSSKGVLIRNMAYDIAGASTITLLYPADDGEIIEGIIDPVAITGNNIVDAKPIVASGTLAAGDTDFNVGEPYEVGKYPLTQHGSVLVFVDAILLRRNTGNQAPGPGVDGDYYEVHAGAGLGTIIRLNTPDLVNDRYISVVSVAALAERPNGSMMAFIESVNGKVDSMIPTLASLAEVDESTFGGVSNVDLKAFGDSVNDLKKILDIQITSYKTAYLKDYRSNNTGGQTLTTGASGNDRELNTIEGDSSFVSLTNGTTGVDGTANQFILQAGTYKIEAYTGSLRTNDNALRLLNITDSTTIIDYQLNQWSDSVDADGQTIATLFGQFTLGGSKTLSLNHRVQTTAGGGNQLNFGTNELYATVVITKIETKTIRELLGL